MNERKRAPSLTARPRHGCGFTGSLRSGSTRRLLPAALVLLVALVTAAAALWYDRLPSPERGGSRTAEQATSRGDSISSPIRLAHPCGSGDPAGPVSTAQAKSLALIEEATEAVDRAISDYPHSPLPLILMGRLQFQFGSTSQAIACWEGAAELDPDLLEPYLRLAVAAEARADYADVLAYCEDALARDPGCVMALEKMATALLYLGRPEETVALVKRHAPICNRSARALVAAGQAYLKRQEPERARTVLRRAVQLAPENTEAYYALANAHRQLGHHDAMRACQRTFSSLERKRACARARRLKQHDDLGSIRAIVASVFAELGMLHVEHEARAKAEPLWLRAAAIDPQNTVCRRMLLSLYLQQGRERKAAALVEQLQRIDRGNENARKGDDADNR